MSDVDRVVRGGWVVSDYETEALPDGAVALSGQTIQEVGRYRDIRNQYPNAEVLGGERFLVIPGLINGHSHGRGLTSFQRGTRDNTLETWILGTQQQKAVPVSDDVSLSAAKLLRSGVTTTMHNHIVRDPLQYEKEFEEAIGAYAGAGMRVLFCPSIRNDNLLVYGDGRGFLESLPGPLREYLTRPSPAGGFSDKIYVETISRLHEAHHGPLCRLGFGPLAPQWCTEALLLEVKKEAERLGLPIHIHTLESVFQKIYGLRFLGRTLIESLNALGFLGEGTTLGHCVWPTESDIRLLARTGTGVTHQPCSNLRLRTGISPVAEMLEQGVCVGLGMDGTTINDNDDLIQEMKVCLLLQRLSSLEPDSPCLSPRRIFQMATVNNAALLGYKGELGRIRPGYFADLVLLDYQEMCHPYADPTHDPIDVLLCRGLGRHVHTVLAHGKVVVRQGELTTLDESAVAERLAEAASKPMDEDEKVRADRLEELRGHVGRYYSPWLDDVAFEPYWPVHSRIDGMKRRGPAS